MINQYSVISLLLVILLLGGSKSLTAQEALGKIKCICIDAGHGGFANKEGDPGAIGALTQEKHLTL